MVGGEPFETTAVIQRRPKSAQNRSPGGGIEIEIPIANASLVRLLLLPLRSPLVGWEEEEEGGGVPAGLFSKPSCGVGSSF